MSEIVEKAPEWNFRLAGATDAEAFTKWAFENPQIDRADIWAATKKKNPTVVFFAVEKDGVVQTFAPFYAQMILAHLGFNPDAGAEDRKHALQVMLDGASAFAVQYGIREIVTLSKEEYPVAQWAMKNGFDLEPRQVLKLDLNKAMEPVEA
jgi:hypothetical protein